MHLLASLTPAELRELDQRMRTAQIVGAAVWPATWTRGPLNADITDVRREINAVYPFGGEA